MQTCANCGTEVDEDAAFCPTCGQPLGAEPITPSAPPPAPAWDDEELEPDRGEPAAAWSRPARDEPLPEDSLRDQAPDDTAPAWDDATDEPPPPVVEAAPPPVAPVQANRAAPPRDAGPGRSSGQPDLPFTLPVTLSGWLIGGGSLIGAIALFVDFRLFSNPITLLLLVLLLGVAATVFLSSTIPAIAYRQLAVMAIIFAGLGVALDRIGFGSIVGVGSAILLLAMIAAATGVIIAETGRDRPWSGPGGRG